jgi:hypothetical protein
MVWKEIEALNTEAWGNKNFDENVRQYEDNKIFQAEESQKQRDWQSAEADKERAFTASENAKNRAASRSVGGGGGGGPKTYSFNNSEIKEMRSMYQNMVSDGNSEDEAILSVLMYAEALGKPADTEEKQSIITSLLSSTPSSTESSSNDGKKKDTGINWLGTTIKKKTDTVNWMWGLDNDDVYTVDGKDYYAKDIEKAMEEAGYAEATIDTVIKSINKLKEGKTYKYGG